MIKDIDDLGFTAPAVKEDEISEYSFEDSGTTVLAFFPGAFTEPCTDELCVLRDSMKDFEELDVEVIGISVDTPFSIQEFKDRNSFNFTLVSDHSKQIIDQYEVRTDFEDIGYHGLAERAVFIIQDGEIVYEKVMDDPHNIPDVDQIKEKLKEL